jgi:hypothetical protein
MVPLAELVRLYERNAAESPERGVLRVTVTQTSRFRGLETTLAS